MKFTKSQFITLLLFLFYSISANSQNLTNSSFEIGVNNQPSGWLFETWDKYVSAEWSDVSRSGKKSISISGTEKGWAHWMSKLPLKPYSRYRFSGWVKTENISAEKNGGAGYTVGNLYIPDVRPITGTNDWMKVEFIFDSNGDDSGIIECVLGLGASASGKAWFDDVKLQLISSKKLSPKISIDISDQKQHISEYIYGQFIEHLGKCIYGGIWAEVINDRKFFYAPGKAESPWKLIGDTNCFKLSAAPYVGKNTPQIITSDKQYCGIEQENIPLLKGIEYKGRIVIAGKLEKSTVKITLKWGEGNSEKQTIIIENLDEKYLKIPLQFSPGNTTENGSLTIIVEGEGNVKIGTISLMPANNINGFRADVIALLKELNSPVYRWPGGNFVSGYNWKDGIGDPDRRPPRKNPAWTGVEHNDVGIDEFMQLCKILNTEPFIAVNSGLGGVQLATEEVEYCNGAVGTTMGHLRADNGNAESYNVKFWSVGNEMYGDWQLGHMTVDEYVKKHNEFADAIHQVDSAIELIAVGNVGTWDEMMLNNCSDNMDYISEHIYRQDWHGGGLMTHTKQLADDIRYIADAHRKYRNELPALKGKNIRIAMDEWNYWYGPHIFGELGTRYFWRDGMGIAAGLHEFFRNSDIYYMANYAQTVNVIGCIKTTGTTSAFETTGLVLKMYRQYFGEIPVAVSGEPEPLDISAALSKDKSKLTVAVMNPSDQTYNLPFKIKGCKIGSKILMHLIHSDDDMVYNEPGKEPKIKIEDSTISEIGNKLTILPKSVSIYKLNIEN
jgi:alpha-N-arabinofuranosidase